MTQDELPDAPIAANRWAVLVTTSVGGFLGSVMFTSVNVAVPTLVAELNTGFNVVQWVVLAYLLATGTLLPIVGRAADLFGKKALFLGGWLTFTLGSLLCALAPGVEALIAFRALQGVGAAALTALSLALVTDVFPTKERGRALGISGSILSTGIVVGPTLGGFLVDALSWHWIFLAAVPVGLLGSLATWRFIPRYQRAAGQRFDLPGAVLLFVTLVALSLALTAGQDLGFAHPRIVTLFLASGLLLVLFVLLELRLRDPLLDLRLFRSLPLTIGLVTGFATFISIAGTVFMMPFYLENVLGFAPRNVGLLMSVVPVVLVFMAPLAGAAADRFGERPVTLVGLSTLLVGYLAVGGLGEDTTALGYVLRFLPIGLGMGIFQTPNNSAIMGAVERRRSGVAGGLLALTRALGQISGIAVLGTLWAARVLARSGGGNATEAPPAAQIDGLGDMFLVIQVAISLALALVLWDLVRHVRRRSPAATTEG